ncbi:aldehyde dehydrogenase family protein [Arthrobacter oryzae]|uniref:aldehyde dehydrogenase family protein n=1 Tax=Arthrobacter oryzae TaxID=409290 RepID=UPI00286A11B2|nr:aldehyde dehydrogenase family protein [Arthrobacter oryzae]
MNLVAHKLGPALIGGNGVVLKPFRRTPLTGLALDQLLLESGVPSGRMPRSCPASACPRRLWRLDVGVRGRRPGPPSTPLPR